jgi:hypothetical protein
MSGRKSRTKGKRFEQEIARDLRERGYPEAWRGDQRRDGANQPDVNLDGCWLELKRLARVSWADVINALEQAGSYAPPGLYQAAVIRRDRQAEPVVCMKFSEWCEMYAELRNHWGK